VFDFYKDRFNRYSYDNNGSNIISNCHTIFTKDSNGEYVKNNAAWSPVTKQMYFGDGDGITNFGFSGEADIMGHEFTHAVTGSEVRLNYSGESGAIDEALADLFGEAFESFVKEKDPIGLK
jgi:Zn-dependent metalloprotease